MRGTGTLVRSPYRDRTPGIIREERDTIFGRGRFCKVMQSVGEELGVESALNEHRYGPWPRKQLDAKSSMATPAESAR
jgi:hypothetical protein